MKNWLEDELHPVCAKDYLLLCNEQLRQDKVVNQLGTMVRDLIKVNLEREILGFTSSTLPGPHRDAIGHEMQKESEMSELQSHVYDQENTMFDNQNSKT